MVKIFRGRILREVENYSWKLLGLFESDLAALVDFFKTPWREPVDTINKFDRHFVLAIAGFHLTAMGRATEALQPTQSSLEAFTREGEWQACGVVSKNLSELHLLLGDIERALQHAQNAVEFATRHGDTLQMLDSQSCLANAQHHAGRLNEAETLFRQIEAMQASARPRYPLLYSQNGFCYSNLLLRRNDYECVITRSEATLKLAEEGWYGPLAMGMDHLSLGRALLLKWRRERTSELGLVEEHVQQALHYFRIYGTQSYVGLALLARAELRREQGMFEEARENLNDVFDVVGRGSMHLYEIQCRLEQVRLSLATGDRQRASEYLAIAREMAERSRSHLWDSELELLRTQAEV
jgi:tetratricopeptide (TPR) repeat protein